ncbi:MAG: hypothetical protein L3J22_05715 [Xanthomonadales bacterium]|nr:hypothetical protein [Xanthomonadales bacterium]
MIDQSRVTSGYNFECLFAATYFEHIFMSAIDTGDIPTRMTVPLGSLPGAVQIDLQTFTPLRDYVPNPSAVTTVANPASFRITNMQDGDPLVPGIALEHVLLTLAITLDVSDPTTGSVILPNGQATVDVLVSLLRDFEALEGSVVLAHTNVRLGLQMVSVAGPLVTTLTDAPYGLTQAQILAALAGLLPSSLPFDITGRDGPLRSIDMRFLPGNGTHQDAVGIYANLLLRLPTYESRRPVYGSDSGASIDGQNFLPLGQDYAVAMSPRLFSGSGNLNSIGRHFQELIDEIRDTGKTEVFGTDVPVNLSMLNKRFKILYVKMFSRADGLRLSIRCRYNAKLLISSLDPAGTIQIDFRPEWDDDGMLHWGSSIGISTSGLARLFNDEFTGITFLLNRFISVLYRQEYASDPGFATAMDLLATTVTVARKRWDPFYTSLHQIRVNIVEVQSNRGGLSLCGTVQGLGRKRFPVDDLVIRDKTRDPDGTLTGLRYVVPGLGTLSVDLLNTFIATDRLQLTPVVPVPDYPDTNSSLITISIEDIQARLNQNGLPPPVVYRLLRVQPFEQRLEDHSESTLVRLMGISLRERDRINDAIWDERYAAVRQSILDNREDEIREDATNSLPGDAEADEIDLEFRIRLNAATNIGTRFWFGTEAGVASTRAAFDALMRLEMHPHEWGLLQEMGVLEVQGYRLISRQGRFYYRDDPRWQREEPSEEEPDNSLIDNLAELPHILRFDINTNSIGHISVLAQAPATVLETGSFTLRSPDGSVAETQTFAGLNHADGHLYGAAPAGDQFAGWRICWTDPTVQPDAAFQTGEICTPPHTPP